MTNVFSLLLWLAAAVCGEHKMITDTLESKYGEVLVFSAVDSAGYLIEVVANNKTGTWTSLLTRARGITCIIDSGVSWRVHPITETPGEEDA